jgi:hypothetical protein
VYSEPGIGGTVVTPFRKMILFVAPLFGSIKDKKLKNDRR